MSSRVLVVVGAIGVVALALWVVLGSGDFDADTSGTTRPALREHDAGTDSTADAGPILQGHTEAEAAAGATAAAIPARSGSAAPTARRTEPAGTAAKPGDAFAELRILLGGGEAAIGRVRVRPAPGASTAENPAAEHVIGPGGALRIPTPGDVYLDVLVEGRQARWLSLRREHREAPVKVVFGTGTVFGTVRDGLGLPSRDVPVRLSTHLESTDEGARPIAEGHVFQMAVLTDADGTFRFEDLPVGDFVLVARRAPDDPAADRNIRSVRVSLAAGESAQVDFGKEDLEPLLTGVLRYGDGVAVTRPVHMFLTVVGGGGRLYVNTDAEGRFSHRLPPGTYEVEMVIDVSDNIMAGMRIVTSSQRFLVEERDTVHDIAFPGTRVEGRVRGLAKGQRQEVRATLLEPEGKIPVSRISKQPLTTQRVAVTKDETFRLDGLSPGLWRLTGTPLALRPVEIRVDALRDVITTDLDIEAR